jgi:hypothetical protein
MENALSCGVSAVRARPSHPDDPRPASDQRTVTMTLLEPGEKPLVLLSPKFSQDNSLRVFHQNCNPMG